MTKTETAPVYIWPDNTVAAGEEAEEYSFMSDDYLVVDVDLNDPRWLNDEWDYDEMMRERDAGQFNYNVVKYEDFDEIPF